MLGRAAIPLRVRRALHLAQQRRGRRQQIAMPVADRVQPLATQLRRQKTLQSPQRYRVEQTAAAPVAGGDVPPAAAGAGAGGGAPVPEAPAIVVTDDGAGNTSVMVAGMGGGAAGREDRLRALEQLMGPGFADVFEGGGNDVGGVDGFMQAFLQRSMSLDSDGGGRMTGALPILAAGSGASLGSLDELQFGGGGGRFGDAMGAGFMDELMGAGEDDEDEDNYLDDEDEDEDEDEWSDLDDGDDEEDDDGIEGASDGEGGSVDDGDGQGEEGADIARLAGLARQRRRRSAGGSNGGSMPGLVSDSSSDSGGESSGPPGLQASDSSGMPALVSPPQSDDSENAPGLTDAGVQQQPAGGEGVDGAGAGAGADAEAAQAHADTAAEQPQANIGGGSVEDID
jgi:hypothetical protein